MEADEFIQMVQESILDSNSKTFNEEDVLKTIQAILITLSEFLQPRQSQQLAATLPSDIGHYLIQNHINETESLNDFFHCVAVREGTTLPRAIHHSRTVIAVLQEVVPAETLQKIKEQLPYEFAPLFQ